MSYKIDKSDSIKVHFVPAHVYVEYFNEEAVAAFFSKNNS